MEKAPFSGPPMSHWSISTASAAVMYLGRSGAWLTKALLIELSNEAMTERGSKSGAASRERAVEREAGWRKGTECLGTSAPIVNQCVAESSERREVGPRRGE